MNTPEHSVRAQTQIEYARAFYNPDNMGFKPYGSGWEKEIPGVGTVVFLPLTWEHRHMQVSLNKWKKGNALELVSRIQQQVFKMRRDRDAGAPAHLGNIAKRGGSVVVAFSKNDEGFNYKSWLGFGIVEGGDDQKAISEFIGVKDEFRDKDIGAQLRLIQMHLALEKGKTKFELEMGPLRGRMANQSIRKLGGTADEFILAKYLGMDYKLYGPETEDRIKITFDLLNTRTQEKMKKVAFGVQEESSGDIDENLIVTGTNVDQKISESPDRLYYEIPEEADTLRDKEKHRWRNEMARVFQALLTHEKVYKPDGDSTNIVYIGSTMTKGKYIITDFISENKDGKRRNFYVLTKK